MRIDAPVDAEPRSGRNPAAGVSRRRAGLAVHQRRRLPLPHARQPLRHHGAGAIPLPRFARAVAATRRAASRSGRPDAAAAAVLEDAVDGPADPAAEGPHGPGAGLRNDDRPTAAIEVVARRRRGLHHAAASLYRRPRPARLGPQQPGHVPRAAFRRAVRAEPRGGAALPDPPRHRRPSRRGPAARRDAAGERVRGRAAGHDRGRRDAAARGHERTGLGRRARAGGACR